jgi:HAMP domain-containing protein
MKIKTLGLLVVFLISASVAVAQYVILSLTQETIMLQDGDVVERSWIQKLSLSPQFLNLYIFLSAISMGSLIGFLFFLLGKTIIPIEKISGIINNLSRGETSNDIDPKIVERQDEVGDLGRAFQRVLISFRISLRESAPELKKKIEEEEKMRAEKMSKFKKVFNFE